MTVRSTCHGVAPSAAAASAGRTSRDSHAAPTERITTATLKKTRPATMATGVPSRPSPERPGLAEQLAERHPDHHGRQHERHQQRRPDQPPAGDREPVQRVGGGHPEQHRDGRRHRRGPHGEPRHPQHPRAGEHVQHPADVEPAVDPEAPRHHPGHREHEEDAEHQHRPEGQRGQGGAAASPADDVRPLGPATARGGRRCRPASTARGRWAARRTAPSRRAPRRRR